MQSKSIAPRVAETAGVLSAGDLLLYPYPCGERTVWKNRDVSSGKQWNEPVGLTKSDELLPFCALRSDTPTIVVWCEGESDALAVASALQFASNVSVYAVPGSSNFREHWSSLGIGLDNIVVPDGDAAGRAFAQRIAGYLPDARIVRMNEGHDACTMLAANTGWLEQAIEQAEPLPLSEVPIPKPSRPSRARTDYAHGLIAEAERDGIVLTQKGGEYVGLCPFHADSRPSLWINAYKGLFHCKSCGARGDAITWVRGQRGLGYVEAREYLQGKYA